MPTAQFAARSLNDIGLAAWFGGSLMGAVGLNGAAARNPTTAQNGRVAGRGWSAWTPVNFAAIGAHLAGSTTLAVGNRARLFAQRNVASVAIAKTALTAAALGGTAYARAVGQRVIEAEEPATSGTEPATGTSKGVADAQRRLRVLQWVIPALTGAMIVCDAVLGEQQRPTNVVSGVARRLLPGHRD